MVASERRNPRILCVSHLILAESEPASSGDRLDSVLTRARPNAPEALFFGKAWNGRDEGNHLEVCLQIGTKPLEQDRNRLAGHHAPRKCSSPPSG